MLNSDGRGLIIQPSEQGVPRLHQRFLIALLVQIQGSLSAVHWRQLINNRSGISKSGWSMMAAQTEHVILLSTAS